MSADVIRIDPHRGSNETFLDPLTLHSKYKSNEKAIEKSATSCTVKTNAVWISMFEWTDWFYIWKEEKETVVNYWRYF